MKAAADVWERILKVPQACDIVMRLEEQYGLESPLNSAYTMQSFVQKTRTLDNLLWALSGLEDILKTKLTFPNELTNKALTGKNAGGKGLIDLLLYKKEFGEHMIGKWAAHRLRDEDNASQGRGCGR